MRENVQKIIDWYKFAHIKLCIIDTIGAVYDLEDDSTILRFTDINQDHLISILRDYAKECVVIFDNIYKWYNDTNIGKFHDELMKLTKENKIGVFM
jgi:hypothetical protein